MNLQYTNQELQWHGTSLLRVADLWQKKNHDFPLYLYSKTFLKTRFQQFQAAFPKARIHFAMKSNHWPPLLRELCQLGAHVDVVSFGEVQAALAAGFRPDQILFSGVGKTQKEINGALEVGVFQINVEGEDELNKIIQTQKPARIGLRWTPGLDAKTHPFIRTGHEDTKFGMSDQMLLKLIQSVKKHPQIQLQGLSMHLGSQIQDLSDYQMAYRSFLDLIKSCPVAFTHVDLGGGLGIDYHSQDPQVDTQVLAGYKKIVDEIWGHTPYQILFEPGRFISARAGGLLTQVQAIKKTKSKNIVVVDAGMHQLIRPVLYEAYHGIFPLKQPSQGASTSPVDVVGPICESSDFLALNRDLPEVQVGDFLWVADAGAYGSSMASRYNLRPEAEEIFIEDLK